MFDWQILTKLESKTGCWFANANISAVAGGDINQAFCVLSNGKKVFVKQNKLALDNVLAEEEKGLLEIAKCLKESAPKIILQSNTSKSTFLALEWIESGIKTNLFWRELGKTVANLHKNSYSQFGFHRNNYIGSLKQTNTWSSSWATFFIEHRLEPQIKLAYDANLISHKHKSKFQNLFIELDSIFPSEKPALLHGDLWSGNVMCNSKGFPILIDPATYYGHREMDLAFTQMFGGFSYIFYETYFSLHPVVQGFSERVPIYNLYPALVHLNLFGKAYLPTIEKCILKF